MKTSIQAGIAGALVALILAGGFLALDKTTLHWYADSNGSHSKPVFTDQEVAALTEFAIEDGTFKLPQNAHFAKCTKAAFQPGNDKWIVTCEFRTAAADATPLQTRFFVFDDAGGHVVASTS